MKVSTLIERLLELPQNADVCPLRDGVSGGPIEYVWLSQSGSVITSGRAGVCFHDEDRPEGAPTEQQDAFWYFN